MIKAVVFDMDGVLFDTERISMEIWRQVGKAMGFADIEPAVTGCVGRNRTGILRFFSEHYGSSFPAEEFLQRSSEAANEQIERDGLPVMKGARELLHYLKQTGCPAGLASSTRSQKIMEHLKRSGLTDCFEVIIGGDMVENGKPAPDIYLMACRELGVKPEEAIAIEDSPNGIRSAHAAHMLPVMVPDMIAPAPEIEALLWRKCDSLTDVLKLLEEMRL